MPDLLIVEDDAAIRKMYARALAHLGNVIEAENGQAALDVLWDKTFDLILLDLNMAGIDGLGVLKAIDAKKGPNSETPVMVITADPSADTRAEAIKKTRFYLAKPVRLNVLTTLVAGVMGKNPKDASPNKPHK